MFKDSSARYYQENKEKNKKKSGKRYQNLKKKNENMVTHNIRISRKMKINGYCSIEKEQKFVINI